MRLEEAEMILQLMKLDGPIPEHWQVQTDEGIMFEAWPLGFARGTKGVIELTVQPHYQYSRLFTGGTPVRMSHGWHKGIYGSGLWEQEFWVYMKELKQASIDALKDLFAAPYLRRPYERDFSAKDPRPHAADFGGGITTKPGPDRPQISKTHWWFYGGPSDPLKLHREILEIKRGFCKLLDSFIKGEHPLCPTPRTTKANSSNTPSCTTPNRPKTKPRGTSTRNPYRLCLSPPS